VPINVKPHYPPPRFARGLVGDFDPIFSLTVGHLINAQVGIFLWGFVPSDIRGSGKEGGREGLGC